MDAPVSEHPMLRAALALSRALAREVATTNALASPVLDLAYEARMLASSAATFARRAEDGTLDLSRVVNANSIRLKMSAEKVRPLVNSVTGASAFAQLAAEAIEHAYLHARSHHPIPGASAALLLRALWEDGETWSSSSVQSVAGFCSLADLSTVMERDDALGVACAGLGVEEANAVRVCVAQNATVAIADARAAILLSLE
jgi:hypothetical protein